MRSLPLKIQNLATLAKRVVEAQQRGAAVIILMGAHVIRSGVSRLLIDLMERGFIDLIGCNGAVTIHDMEFAMIGKTTESVAKYIQTGAVWPLGRNWTGK